MTSLPSTTSLSSELPQDVQTAVISHLSGLRTSIDNAFWNSPAVTEVDTVAPPDDHEPDVVSPRTGSERDLLTYVIEWPTEWRCLLSGISRSVWEEHYTGITVQISHTSTGYNVSVLVPTPGNRSDSDREPETLATVEQFREALLTAQLMIDMVAPRVRATHIGPAPGHLSRFLDDTGLKIEYTKESSVGNF